MTEPIPCGCGGKAIVKPGNVHCRGCRCMVFGESREEVVEKWNRAMGKDLRDAVDAVIQDIDCMSDNEVKDTLYAARKGAK